MLSSEKRSKTRAHSSIVIGGRNAHVMDYVMDYVIFDIIAYVIVHVIDGGVASCSYWLLWSTVHRPRQHCWDGLSFAPSSFLVLHSLFLNFIVLHILNIRSFQQQFSNHHGQEKEQDDHQAAGDQEVWWFECQERSWAAINNISVGSNNEQQKFVEKGC